MSTRDEGFARIREGQNVLLLVMMRYIFSKVVPILDPQNYKVDGQIVSKIGPYVLDLAQKYEPDNAETLNMIVSYFCSLLLMDDSERLTETFDYLTQIYDTLLSKFVTISSEIKEICEKIEQDFVFLMNFEMDMVAINAFMQSFIHINTKLLGTLSEKDKQMLQVSLLSYYKHLIASQTIKAPSYAPDFKIKTEWILFAGIFICPLPWKCLLVSSEVGEEFEQNLIMGELREKCQILTLKTFDYSEDRLKLKETLYWLLLILFNPIFDPITRKTAFQMVDKHLTLLRSSLAIKRPHVYPVALREQYQLRIKMRRLPTRTDKAILFLEQANKLASSLLTFESTSIDLSKHDPKDRVYAYLVIWQTFMLHIMIDFRLVDEVFLCTKKETTKCKNPNRVHSLK
ncbi:hypothetical protein Ciccas_010731 [Cichlidogyrus casuarinus]|uniref:Uncharacterized protein n=1 Tax=Cichlidogyrus casuarinus TaxID=1844966 RepID=A0ABD2PUH3_9PLAT